MGLFVHTSTAGEQKYIGRAMLCAHYNEAGTLLVCITVTCDCFPSRKNCFPTVVIVTPSLSITAFPSTVRRHGMTAFRLPAGRLGHFGASVSLYHSIATEQFATRSQHQHQVKSISFTEAGPRPLFPADCKNLQ